ncbi:MAG: lytic transglycosylase domain-containing protein [Caulobacteraceae bacterium]
MTVESVKLAVGAAIQRASEATGADFGFLMRTAARESGYNPAAHASSSSAAGLFQFVEQTWLGALKRHGAKHGYGGYADLIQETGDGRLSVTGGEAKKAVLALRLDPKAASLMAGELAGENSTYLKGRVGREPTAGELYVAHFLGPKGSAELIEATQSRPGATAAALFPDAASANPAIFYRDGRAASVAEVYVNLTGGQSAAAPASPTTAAPVAAPAEPRFVHSGVEARLARIEQERQLADMILGIDPGENNAFGLGSAKTSGSRGLTNSLFTSEMLALLSQARQGSGRG